MIFFLVFFLAIVIGFINTLVGSGSLIMIPLLIQLGLSPNVANGTNRVGVFFQSLTGAITVFREKKKLPINWKLVILPSLLGAILGAWVATQVKPMYLNHLINGLLVLMLGIVLLKPEKWLGQKEDSSPKITFITHLLMFASGFYGGFIQGGVGIFLLATLVLSAGYSATEANGLKLLVIVAYVLPVLLVFVWYAQVDWFWGLLTALGQSIGAYLGAKFSLRHQEANLWTYRLLIVVLSLAIAQASWQYLKYLI